MALKPILGTMTFGPQVDLEESAWMIRLFLQRGYRELDTAYVYNDGQSEKYIGNVWQEVSKYEPWVSTKVNPRVTGKLDRNSVYSQLTESLQRLELESVGTLYLHFPDQNTPLEQTLEACAELYQSGSFKELGLSNYPAWEVVHIWHLCNKYGWPQPKVYQGLYNGLSRAVESELLPALRALGMRFYAYNPLAGGILSGRYSDFETNPSPGRFTYRPNYKDRYWNKDVFQVMDNLKYSCEVRGISLIEAAFRWLGNHSAMDHEQGDGVLIGASSTDQLLQNLSLLDKGPLPAEIVSVFNDAWEQMAAKSPKYFRSA